MLEQTFLMPRAAGGIRPSGDNVLTLDRRYSDKSPSSRKSSVVQDVTFVPSPEEALPQSAMLLKQATANYAMYLSFADRDRLFGELDFLLEPDGWDEDDALPARDSYINFLKWAVETKAYFWTSLSLDGDGHTVAAFARDRNVITATFVNDATVHWTSRITTEDGIDVSAGKSPLRSFASISASLLERL